MILMSIYYRSRVNDDSLLLRDLFLGSARMQFQNESELVVLEMPSAKNIWDQKLSIFRSGTGTTLTTVSIFSYLVWPYSFSPNTTQY